ncbi:sigma-70 family RNA polymerase sigma factor [Aquincola sp. MAHUQ-54]|uniref:RNA polymerase sigma factor n=1 Tax=Aquincola agrisoli TaxID=3119538 RepID=A0AAW9QK34_9BURK
MDIARRHAAPVRRTPAARMSRLSVVTLQQGRGAMPKSDELNELASAVATHGDRQAFAALFKHFAPRVKAYLMRSGSAEALAEELAQETMVSVWRKAASFDPARAQVSTWIFTIARNLRIDHHRRQGGALAEGIAATAAPAADEADAPGLEPQTPCPLPALDEQVGAREREHGVRQALAQLPSEQAQLLRLSFFEGQPHAWIAGELQIPLGTVKSRIRLAVKQLRRLLDRFEP